MREKKIIEREAFAERLVKQVTELLDGVAEQLGIARGVKALRAAVSSIIEHREERSALEDASEETGLGL